MDYGESQAKAHGLVGRFVLQYKSTPKKWHMFMSSVGGWLKY